MLCNVSSIWRSGLRTVGKHAPRSPSRDPREERRREIEALLAEIRDPLHAAGSMQMTAGAVAERAGAR